MYDIAIIGFGPVGATLANFLGRDGWHVVALEIAPEIFPIPRAVHVDDEAQRIWQSAEIHHLVSRAFGGYPPDRQYINAKGRVFFETHLNTRKPYGYQSNMYFHQPTLEAALDEGIADLNNVELKRGVSAIGISQDVDGVLIESKDQQSGTIATMRARFAIGCDGGRSFVRKSVGISLHDLKFEQPWLVTDFYLNVGLTLEDVGLPHAHQQFCDPAQPISFIPQGAQNHYRFEFMLTRGVTKEMAEDPAYVRKMLSQVIDLDKIDIVRGAVYTFHSLIAERWRDQRILIAGDAAHQMPPFAGQGMCSGLRDAHNLSWKLGLVLGGQANAALLDSYEMERKPHVTRMTKGTMFLGNLVQTQNPFRAWVRDLLFRTVFKIPSIFGRIATYALRGPSLTTTLGGGSTPAAIGTYFIQPQVAVPGGETCLLDDLLGSGFAILGLESDPAPYIVEQLTLPIRCLQIGRDLVDMDNKLEEWFVENSAEFVIIRPDRYVFGAYTVNTINNAAADLKKALHLTP